MIASIVIAICSDWRDTAEYEDPMEEIQLQRHKALVMIRNTPKGRGVFAKEAIPSGTVIETCPVLIFPLCDLDALKTTIIDHYSYNWPLKDPSTGKITTTQALSLGLGSIFNHSSNQNVGFQRDLNRQLIVYRTVRDVVQGEELCISYGSSLWFENADRQDVVGGPEQESILEAIQIGLD